MKTIRLILLALIFLTLAAQILLADPPSGVIHQQTTYINEPAGVTLAGTLTLPEGKGPFPAAVLVGGSGPGVRGPYFLLIADALAQRGIAALCYDKRGAGDSSGNYQTATCEDFEKDALAGLEYLRHLPQINPQKVGMIGHSEGGMIVPMAADDSENIDFIVLMAGPGISGEKGGDLYVTHKASALGANTKTIQVLVRMLRDANQVIKTQKDDGLARKKMDEILEAGFSGLSQEEKGKALFVLGGDSVEAVEDKALSPWYRDKMGIDYQVNLRKVKCPVLAMNGDKDGYVACPENLNAIGEALKEGHNPDYTLKMFPGLNHAFQRSKTSSPKEVVPSQATMDPEALQFMVDWIVKHTQ
jgi:uncharacterized protein